MLRAFRSVHVPRDGTAARPPPLALQVARFCFFRISRQSCSDPLRTEEGAYCAIIYLFATTFLLYHTLQSETCMVCVQHGITCSALAMHARYTLDGACLSGPIRLRLPFFHSLIFAPLHLPPNVILCSSTSVKGKKEVASLGFPKSVLAGCQ